MLPWRFRLHFLIVEVNFWLLVFLRLMIRNEFCMVEFVVTLVEIWVEFQLSWIDNVWLELHLWGRVNIVVINILWEIAGALLHLYLKLVLLTQGLFSHLLGNLLRYYHLKFVFFILNADTSFKENLVYTFKSLCKILSKFQQHILLVLISHLLTNLLH